MKTAIIAALVWALAAGAVWAVIHGAKRAAERDGEQ